MQWCTCIMLSAYAVAYVSTTYMTREHGIHWMMMIVPRSCSYIYICDAFCCMFCIQWISIRYIYLVDRSIYLGIGKYDVKRGRRSMRSRSSLCCCQQQLIHNTLISSCSGLWSPWQHLHFGLFCVAIFMGLPVHHPSLGHKAGREERRNK